MTARHLHYLFADFVVYNAHRTKLISFLVLLVLYLCEIVYSMHVDPFAYKGLSSFHCSVAVELELKVFNVDDARIDLAFAHADERTVLVLRVLIRKALEGGNVYKLVSLLVVENEGISRAICLVFGTKVNGTNLGIPLVPPAVASEFRNQLIAHALQTWISIFVQLKLNVSQEHDVFGDVLLETKLK